MGDGGPGEEGTEWAGANVQYRGVDCDCNDNSKITN